MISVKAQTVNKVGFVDQICSVATTQLCHCNKCSHEQHERSEHGYMPINSSEGQSHLNSVQLSHIIIYHSSFDFFSTTQKCKNHSKPLGHRDRIWSWLVPGLKCDQVTCYTCASKALYIFLDTASMSM